MFSLQARHYTVKIYSESIYRFFTKFEAQDLSLRRRDDPNHKSSDLDWFIRRPETLSYFSSRLIKQMFYRLVVFYKYSGVIGIVSKFRSFLSRECNGRLIAVCWRFN